MIKLDGRFASPGQRSAIELLVFESPDEGGEASATMIEHTVRTKSDAVLGLATGSSPLSTWRALGARKLDYSRVRFFALDEYLGLPEGHPQRYRAVLRREVLDPLGIDPDFVRLPFEHGKPSSEADAFELALTRSGGVDLQILGIGRNGHIAFNEPGAKFDSTTRVVKLHPDTRADNARFFEAPELVPRFAVTQGIATILRARHIVLVAFGRAKSEVVAQALAGPVSTAVPASVLQLHPRVTVVLDRPAAENLSPAWLDSSQNSRHP